MYIGIGTVVVIVIIVLVILMLRRRLCCAAGPANDQVLIPPIRPVITAPASTAFVTSHRARQRDHH